MAIYCRGSNVAEIYRRGTKVLQVFKKGALVYDAGGGEAFGWYIKKGLVLQLDCRHYDVDNRSLTDEIGKVVFGNITKDEISGGVVSSESLGGAINWDIDNAIEVCVDLTEKKNFHIELCNSSFNGTQISLGTFDFREDDEEEEVKVYGIDFKPEDPTASTSKFVEFPQSVNGVVTITAKRDCLYINGVRYDYRYNYAWADAGSGESNIRANAPLYSIRYYEALTQEQITHNRDKDIDNFGGGDIPNNALVDSEGYLLVDSDGYQLVSND